MRSALVKWLTSKAKLDSRIFLLTADLGYSVLESYVEEHSERFLNVGVAEQNMVGVATGLAMEGFLPYTYSIGIFPTFRCAEQIRNDIDYHCLPVVTCSVGSGVAYGNLGYSHHAIQDLSLMRSLPNMVIATPADPLEVQGILDWHYKNPCPLYLRLHKAGEPQLGVSETQLELGALRPVWRPSIQASTSEEPQICILAIGHIAGRVVNLSHSKSSSIPVYSVPLWGRPASKQFSEQISEYDVVITVEDHVLEGGFGSYVMEVAAANSLKARVIPVALGAEVVGSVAREETLLKPLIKVIEDLLDLGASNTLPRC
jgi:transketolase